MCVPTQAGGLWMVGFDGWKKKPLRGKKVGFAEKNTAPDAK